MWDYDVWFQLACGRAIAAVRGLPAHDLFSFTAADRAWDTQEWLAQVLCYGLWRGGGLTLLTLAKAGLAAWLLVLLARDGARKSPPVSRWIALGACAWGAYVMRWHLVERPQMCSMVLLAVELGWLRGGGPRWPIVPLTLLWANLHGGSALVGPGVFGLWIASEAAAGRRRPAVADFRLLGGAVAVILCNPAGWHLYAYPFATLRDPMYMANILEWTPPRVWDQPEFYLWLGAAAGGGLAGWKAWTLPDLMVGLMTTGLAFSARRHIPLAVIAVTPPLIRGLAALGRPELLRVPPQAGRSEGLAARMETLPAPWHALPRWLPGLSVAGAVTCLALAAGRGEALRLGVREDLYPAVAVNAVAAMEAQVRGSRSIRVFALHRWGGYCLWRLPPRFKQFIDGRQLVYGPQLFADYCRILTDVEHNGAALATYAPDILIVEHGSGVTNRLAASSAHALVHWDDTCRVYVRRKAVRSDWLARHAYRAAAPEPRPGAKTAAVLAETERAAREAPEDARPWVIRAEYLLAAGRPDEAWHAAQSALHRRPASVPVLLTACRIAHVRHDPTIAAALARRAERADPGGTAPKLALARLAMAAGRADEAGRLAALAVRRGQTNERRLQRPEPDLTAAWRFRAELAGQADDHVLAATAWRESGNRWYQDGRFREALECYDAGLRAAPADGRLLHNRAAALTELRRTREARTAWRRVLEINPGDPEALRFLGEKHLR